MTTDTDDTTRAQQRYAEVVMPWIDAGHALARWLTGNATDAEDVLQDACTRAWTGIGGYAGGSARAWFFAIVRNCAYAWLARNRPAALEYTDDPAAAEAQRGIDLPGYAPQPPQPPEALAIERADRERLVAAVAALPAVFRETLVLREFHALGYREIAELTQVPIGTVMSRLARARARLIADLGGSPA